MFAFDPNDWRAPSQLAALDLIRETAAYHERRGATPEGAIRLALAEYDGLIRSGLLDTLPKGDDLIVGTIRARDLDGEPASRPRPDEGRFDIAGRRRPIKRCEWCTAPHGGLFGTRCPDCYRKSLDPNGGVPPQLSDDVPEWLREKEAEAGKGAQPPRDQKGGGAGGSRGGGGFGEGPGGAIRGGGGGYSPWPNKK